MYWNSKIFSMLIISYSWIVTLDVLKYDNYIKFGDFNWLNSNIRCIEITKSHLHLKKKPVE